MRMSTSPSVSWNSLSGIPEPLCNKCERSDTVRRVKSPVGPSTDRHGQTQTSEHPCHHFQGPCMWAGVWCCHCQLGTTKRPQASVHVECNNHPLEPCASFSPLKWDILKKMGRLKPVSYGSDLLSSNKQDWFPKNHFEMRKQRSQKAENGARNTHKGILSVTPMRSLWLILLSLNIRSKS